MLAMRKEMVLDFSELRSVRLQCKDCGVGIALDMADKRTRIPAKCPGCNSEFDRQSVQGSLGAFQDAYKSLSNLEHRVSVGIVVEN